MLIKVLQNNVINNEELDKLINNNTLFVGAFSQSCHHCVSMKPEWIKFKKMAQSTYSNLQGVILEIDSSLLSLLTNPLIANNVNGFPSLFIIKDKQVSHYNNERTAFEFMKFFKSNIAKSQNKNKNKNKKYNKYKSYKNKNYAKKYNKYKSYKNKYNPKSFNTTFKK
jgi:thiol-disulfide isomerase/thioredoxin